MKILFLLSSVPAELYNPLFCIFTILAAVSKGYIVKRVIQTGQTGFTGTC